MVNNKNEIQKSEVIEMKNEKFEKLVEEAVNLDIDNVKTSRLNAVRDAVVDLTPDDEIEALVLESLTDHINYYILDRAINVCTDRTENRFLLNKLREIEEKQMTSNPKLESLGCVPDDELDSVYALIFEKVTLGQYLAYWTNYYEARITFSANA